MSNSRDEFPARIKRVVAERAGYICTNPVCRRPTVGPHYEAEKSLKTGEACHISAAAPGGPRYDSEQGADQRCSIANAIWLCTECSTRVDKDADSFPAEMLVNWKGTHEEWIRNGGVRPSLPDVNMTTINGRTLPDVPSEITLSDCEDFREHSLSIANTATTSLLMVNARIQLPEPVVDSSRRVPAGVNVVWEPIRPRMVAHVTGGGTVTRLSAPSPTNVYQLQIDRLPPDCAVELSLITSIQIEKDRDISFDYGPFAGTDTPPRVRNFIDGKFQYEYRNAILPMRFFAPMRYEKETRRFSVREVREDYGEWQPLILQRSI